MNCTFVNMVSRCSSYLSCSLVLWFSKFRLGLYNPGPRKLPSYMFYVSALQNTSIITLSISLSSAEAWQLPIHSNQVC